MWSCCSESWGQRQPITPSIERIAAMSCNPAIGGTAKGHLVKEIDALGGKMGEVIDKTGLQFRVLNRKKGPAVWSSRAQADMDLYSKKMRSILEETKNLHIKQDNVSKLIIENDESDEPKVIGVKTDIFGSLYAKAVVKQLELFFVEKYTWELTHVRLVELVKALISLAEFIRNFGFKSWSPENWYNYHALIVKLSTG